jgi:hypothetical protein
LTNRLTSATDLGYIHDQKFHNGTNVIAKPYTIFLGEEIFEIIMASTEKAHLILLA